LSSGDNSQERRDEPEDNQEEDADEGSGSDNSFSIWCLCNPSAPIPGEEQTCSACGRAIYGQNNNAEDDDGTEEGDEEGEGGDEDAADDDSVTTQTGWCTCVNV